MLISLPLGPLYNLGCPVLAVLLRHHIHPSKTDLLLDEVGLQANPLYSHVRYSDGKEDTVATKHLAPVGSEPYVQPNPETSNWPTHSVDSMNITLG